MQTVTIEIKRNFIQKHREKYVVHFKTLEKDDHKKESTKQKNKNADLKRQAKDYSQYVDS